MKSAMPNQGSSSTEVTIWSRGAATVLDRQRVLTIIYVLGRPSREAGTC